MARLLPPALLLASSLLALGGAAEAPPASLKHYECRRAPTPLRVDGRLDKPEWQSAPWSDWFVDIQGDNRPAPRFKTRMKLLWDDKYLYVGAELEEPDVWATLIEHDSVIYHDNDFEVFLNPTNNGKKYFEFEVNALNTGWDLFLPKPYSQDGHADNGWEIPGLKTAVFVAGTLNHPGDTDRGWTVEMAFPWTAFTERSGKGRPAAGDSWRINFSRVEWRVKVVDGKYEKLPGPEDNWVWSPQGVIDMHVPDKWGIVHFVAAGR
jgi:Carbohydrate family 9 binding domain-like